MSSTPGIDLFRGRPTPTVGTTQAKLQQRKLDALRRGIHRIADAESRPYGIHLIGVGGAGVGVVEAFLRDAPDDLLAVEGSRLSALAVDVDDAGLTGVRALAGRWSSDRALVEAVTLPVPTAADLRASLLRYREFLQLEYPMYHWDPAYEPWLPEHIEPRGEAGHLPRAVAKALYGCGYYDGERPLAKVLRRFGRNVEDTRGDALVCIVFGMAGGTGSGIALDLARHLSNVILGRRVLVTGLCIAPCSGDPIGSDGASLFPLLSELDCLCDEGKNSGITQSCGDLYKNPFTAGVLMVPQEPAWVATHDIADTRDRVDREIAALLTLRRGGNLWEWLRLLNWVAAPSTQHSAARTPWGPKWLHLLGYADAGAGGIGIGPDLPGHLGLRPEYIPEFVEMRSALEEDTAAIAGAAALDRTFWPEVPAQAVGGGRDGAVQFLLPRIAKTDLACFEPARASYDAAPPSQRLLAHALLLEQGIQLCEPSTRIAGMAGAGIGSSAHWIAVPLADVRVDDAIRPTPGNG